MAKTIATLETELKERYEALESRVNALPVVQDYNSLPKWAKWAFIGLCALVVGLYVWFGIKKNQVEYLHSQNKELNQRFDSLQTAAAAQHLITIALLKKDSLQTLSYEGTVKYNNQQREYEKIKTDKEIADMRDLVNRREYDILLQRYWAN